MNERMTVTFYSVSQCGFYRFGQESPEFGNMSGLISDLHRWSQGKVLADTKITEASGDGAQLPIYLSDIHLHKGDALLEMWNEVPAAKDGKINSAPAQARVGEVTVVANKVARGTIPGYPTYFWFVPEHQVMATLRFDQLITGQKAMQEYCEQFLSAQSSHAVLMPASEDENLAVEVYGYRRDERHAASSQLSPRFRTRIFTKPGPIDLIVKRVADIRRVYRRAELELRDNSERAYWQRALRILGMSTPAQQPKKARMQATMSAQLTRAELDSLIEDWKSKHDSKWDDYGFKFQSEPHVHWLGGARASGGFEIDVTRASDSGQIDSEKLLESLMKVRSNALTLMT